MQKFRYKLIYLESAQADLRKIAKSTRRKILDCIKERLEKHPMEFGKPLQGTLKGYRRLRVGDYRIIFHIKKDVVNIFSIGHRKDIYDEK